MCMKRVNATVSLLGSIEYDSNGNPIVLNKPFNQILASIDDDGDYYIDRFNIFTTINLLGTNDANDTENVIRNKGSVDVKIRLTKCDEDESKQLAIDLDEFKIDTRKHRIDEACFEFMDFKRITRVPKIKLPLGTGLYVIKVLMKRSEDKKYTIQTMYQLYIGEKVKKKAKKSIFKRAG